MVLPGWMRSVTGATLRADLVAGLMLAAYMVPAALADAAIAGLPPQAGLHACIFAGAIFWLFSGSSRTVVTVTTGLSLLLGQTVAEMSGGDPARHAALIAAATLWAGAFAALGWALGAGVLARFVSETVMLGFTCGLALHLAAAQLPKLLGFAGHGEDFIDRVVHLVLHVGETNLASLLLGSAALAALLVGKALAPTRPVALVVVVAGIVAGAVFDLVPRGVSLVGAVPQGLPMPGLPDLSRADLRDTLPVGLACFLLAIVETSAVARMFARREGQRYDAGRDMLALAAANLAAGLGRGLAVSGGSSQSVVNDEAGARTPLSGLFAAAVLLVVAVSLTGLLATLPQPVLAAMVLAAVTGLIDIKGLVRAWRFRRSEGLVALAALVGVLAAGLLQGVLIGATLSVVLMLRSALRPAVAELGRVPGTEIFADLAHRPDAERQPGVLVLRCRSAVLYMNAEHVMDATQALLAARPDPVHRVVFDMTAVTALDLPGAEMFLELRRALADRGIALVLAGLRDTEAATLAQAGYDGGLEPHRRVVEVLV